MKLPSSYYNWTSLIGTAVAAISFFLILFFLAIALVFDEGSSYAGLFSYIILPGFLLLGLILIPIGMRAKYRRDRKRKEEIKTRWPVVDMNDKRHRNAFSVFVISTVIFLLASAVGSYEAFHFTESTEFCGTMCHTVMEPEWTAYQNSPHARVGCVECHVGSGASWYVKSKLSGLYQVYSVAFNKYPRPIPTPIESLRPARETCEQCHWPEKFTPHLSRFEKYYLTDSASSEWDINLRIKIGAQYSALGLREGVHWHINPDVRIEYVALDEVREFIPWVRMTNLETGEVTDYFDGDEIFNADSLKNHTVRTMDCMDCHNRPSHDYKSPSNYVDRLMAAGEISRELPDVKKVAMDVLHGMYADRDTALMAIEAQIRDHYMENYPDIYSRKPALIAQAIEGIQQGYSQNHFPYMRVRWDAYPNHIGHLESPGCARCHDDMHLAESGASISRDCNLCHTITAQGPAGNMQVGTIYDSLEFRHPVDIDEVWKDYLCVECHLALY
ncbi:MAG TPA: cytochrome C [Bacteroides sp.]|nr:cytochrome C [Bacteroides sp.]